VLNATAAFLLNVLVTRLLVPQDVGLYFLAVSIVTVGTGFAQMGLGYAVVRLLAEAIARQDIAGAQAIATAAVRLTFVAVAVVAVLFWTGPGQMLADVFVGTQSLRPMMGYVGMWLALAALSHVLAEVFRGHHAIAAATLFGGLLTNTVAVASFATLAVLDIQGVRIEHAVVIMAAASAASAILGFAALGRRGLCGEKPYASPPYRAVLRTAWPLILITCFLLMQLQADLWVIGRLGAPEEVASYGAAARLVPLLGLPMVAVNAVVSPTIVELHARDDTAKLEKILRVATLTAAAPAFVALAAYVAAGGWLLGLAFGPFYREGGGFLAILAIGQILPIAMGPAWVTLVMVGNHGQLLVIAMAMGVLTVGLDVGAASVYGVRGVAWATALSANLYTLVLWAVVLRTAGLRTHLAPPTRRNIAALVTQLRDRARRDPPSVRRSNDG
jgi:O-antigen/teichoic acid export membrane protein